MRGCLLHLASSVVVVAVFCCSSVLAAAATTGPVLLRHAVDTTSDPLAVCNDGSQPVYYATPPAAGVDAWMVILAGQGNQQMPWCYPPDESVWGTGVLSNCYLGPQFAPKPGSQPPSPPPNTTLPCGSWQGGVHCIYSSNCTTNPAFCRLGKILVPQCTFDNWLGDASRQLGNASYPVIAHYRGQRMLKATLTQAAKDLFSPASHVVVAGNDGGGNLLYIAADTIRDIIVAASGIQPSNFAVIPIEGFWVKYVAAVSQLIACVSVPLATMLISDSRWDAET